MGRGRVKIASAFVEVAAPLGDFIRNLNRGQGAFRNFATRLSDMAGNLGSILRNIGGFFAAGLLLKRTLAAGRSFIKLASDAVEATNLVEVTLGRNAAATRRWADSVARSTGLASDQFFFAAGKFSLLLESIGFAVPQALQLSRGMSRLAVDVASLRNVGIEEIFEKLESALVGIPRPLRQIGINVTEVALKQEAMKRGIKTSVEKMTEQQKVLLRLAVILNATKRDVGDLARTSSQYANVSRSLSISLQQIGKNIGSFLLPAVNALAQSLRLITAVVDNVTRLFAQLPRPIRLFAGGILVATFGVIGLSLALVFFGSLARFAIGPIITLGRLFLSWAATSTALGGALQFATASLQGLLATAGIIGTAFIALGFLADFLFKKFFSGASDLQNVTDEFGDLNRQLEESNKQMDKLAPKIVVLGALAKRFGLKGFARAPGVLPLNPSATIRPLPGPPGSTGGIFSSIFQGIKRIVEFSNVVTGFGLGGVSVKSFDEFPIDLPGIPQASAANANDTMISLLRDIRDDRRRHRGLA